MEEDGSHTSRKVRRTTPTPSSRAGSRSGDATRGSFTVSVWEQAPRGQREGDSGSLLLDRAELVRGAGGAGRRSSASN